MFRLDFLIGCVGGDACWSRRLAGRCEALRGTGCNGARRFDVVNVLVFAFYRAYFSDMTFKPFFCIPCNSYHERCLHDGADTVAGPDRRSVGRSSDFAASAPPPVVGPRPTTLDSRPAGPAPPNPWAASCGAEVNTPSLLHSPGAHMFLDEASIANLEVTTRVIRSCY